MERVKKPEWLKIKIGSNEQAGHVHRLVQMNGLHTICDSGMCPNRAECWRRGTATLMIGGDVCTRCCKFCNTKSGRPLPLDDNEPQFVAETVKRLALRHAVITSVDRDDLPDLGATHWARTIRAIKALNPGITMEVLIPDFGARFDLLDQVIDAGPEVIAHNMETVRRLTPEVRSVATYNNSLQVLRHVAQRGVIAKTGIMVGLGETPNEVEELMDDLLAVGCRVLTIGQYLQPTRKHLPVVEYVTLAQFERYKEVAIAKGFSHVESAPLVRSSYHAEKVVGK